MYSEQQYYINKIFLSGGLAKFYKINIKKKFLKYLISDETNPLLGALRIAKKEFPYEISTNDQKIY